MFSGFSAELDWLDGVRPPMFPDASHASHGSVVP